MNVSPESLVILTSRPSGWTCKINEACISCKWTGSTTQSRRCEDMQISALWNLCSHFESAWSFWSLEGGQYQSFWQFLQGNNNALKLKSIIHYFTSSVIAPLEVRRWWGPVRAPQTVASAARAVIRMILILSWWRFGWFDAEQWLMLIRFYI